VRRPYESGWHSVVELTLALPHSDVQWRGWPHREGWRNSARIDSQARQGDDVRGFVFDLGTCRCQSIEWLSRGSGYGGGEAAGASSEAETHPRG
jgi:hypothetical protein